MTTIAFKNKLVALLCGMTILNLPLVTRANEIKDAGDEAGGKAQIEIKDFHFNPQILTVKSGEKITWVNRDEEPHTVVSVEKQFKKSPPLDTDQEFTIIASEPGTYTYFCSVHPKMTGTIVVEKS
jgi:plastocyanin